MHHAMFAHLVLQHHMIWHNKSTAAVQQITYTTGNSIVFSSNHIGTIRANIATFSSHARSKVDVSKSYTCACLRSH